MTKIKISTLKRLRLRGAGHSGEEEKDYNVQKFGIGQEWDKGIRVKSQVRKLNRNPVETVNGLYVFEYALWHRNIRGRWAAKFFEMHRVTKFYIDHGRLPRGQDLPGPFTIPK